MISCFNLSRKAWKRVKDFTKTLSQDKLIMVVGTSPSKRLEDTKAKENARKYITVNCRTEKMFDDHTCLHNFHITSTHDIKLLLQLFIYFVCFLFLFYRIVFNLFLNLHKFLFYYKILCYWNDIVSRLFNIVTLECIFICANNTVVRYRKCLWMLFVLDVLYINI